MVDDGNPRPQTPLKSSRAQPQEKQSGKKASFDMRRMSAAAGWLVSRSPAMGLLPTGENQNRRMGRGASGPGDGGASARRGENGDAARRSRGRAAGAASSLARGGMVIPGHSSPHLGSPSRPPCQREPPGRRAPRGCPGLSAARPPSPS